jgi:hypothetical protein
MKLAGVFRKWFASRPSQAEQQLLRRCLGDATQAERLIGYELARRPHLSRSSASEAALERWTRDR